MRLFYISISIPAMFFSHTTEQPPKPPKPPSPKVLEFTAERDGKTYKMKALIDIKGDRVTFTVPEGLTEEHAAQAVNQAMKSTMTDLK